MDGNEEGSRTGEYWVGVKSGLARGWVDRLSSELVEKPGIVLVEVVRMVAWGVAEDFGMVPEDGVIEIPGKWENPL